MNNFSFRYLARYFYIISQFLFILLITFLYAKRVEARISSEVNGRKNRKGHESETRSSSLKGNSSVESEKSLSNRRRNPSVPAAYLTISEIDTELRYFSRKYHDIFTLREIGKTTALRLPIWGVKISDNADKREDEPRILFVGVHHAREPIGANICLALMQRLCENYGRNRKITQWVNSMEIWFVPVMNPDGYKYILENNLRFPWWRKNLRDNDGDGVFNPLYDGVDLNRNYDYNWQEGGDGKQSSWFYRGKGPFSENETIAIMRLAEKENFVVGVSYHSYGESILFPWGNYKRPPDLELIVDIATQMAAKIRRASSKGKYSILPLNGRVGQSSIWMYGEMNVLDYIVEAGTEYFPSSEDVPFIVDENIKGAEYLLHRMLETGIKGHVFDSVTKRPLMAQVSLLEFAAPHVKPRSTDSQFGLFYRLLKPGTYTVQVRSPGFHSRIVRKIKVKEGEFVKLEIGLRKSREYTSGGNQ